MCISDRALITAAVAVGPVFTATACLLAERRDVFRTHNTVLPQKGAILLANMLLMVIGLLWQQQSGSICMTCMLSVCQLVRPAAGGLRSHKGSAFALIIELLGGAWPGGDVNNKLSSNNWGNLVLAIEPGILGSAEAFKQRVADLCRRVKSARRATGVADMWLPGERSSKLAGKLGPEA